AFLPGKIDRAVHSQGGEAQRLELLPGGLVVDGVDRQAEALDAALDGNRREAHPVWCVERDAADSELALAGQGGVEVGEREASDARLRILVDGQRFDVLSLRDLVEQAFDAHDVEAADGERAQCYGSTVRVICEGHVAKPDLADPGAGEVLEAHKSD